MRALPSRATTRAVTAAALLALAALLAGATTATIAVAAISVTVLAIAWIALDALLTRAAWRAAPLIYTRRLPDAFALGVVRPVDGTLINPGRRSWRLSFIDHTDPDLDVQGLPLALTLPPNSQTSIRYTVQPRRRGRVAFEPAALRVRSRGGSFEWQCRIGEAATRQVFPNFAAVARYAWLATDRRLADIGIKTQVQRGEGTDFKQLAEYRTGDSIRHIDWKATLKQSRPIVREFQDERDQCVIFLLDCGRRMRADEGTNSIHGSHFDEALNALMLLAHVALKDGDEVGALTFGHADRRAFAPRKGRATLNALMAALHDIQPDATHSDYLLAARDLMQVHRKRALIVVLTNFRDEDAAELEPALKLLRSRHLVLLASLRERALRELAEQPLSDGARAVEVAGAHLFTQARRDAFRRLAARDALLVDVEPERLAAELVNRYRAVKRAGLL